MPIRTNEYWQGELQRRTGGLVPWFSFELNDEVGDAMGPFDVAFLLKTKHHDAVEGAHTVEYVFQCRRGRVGVGRVRMTVGEERICSIKVEKRLLLGCVIERLPQLVLRLHATVGQERRRIELVNRPRYLLGEVGEGLLSLLARSAVKDEPRSRPVRVPFHERAEGAVKGIGLVRDGCGAIGM